MEHGSARGDRPAAGELLRQPALLLALGLGAGLSPRAPGTLGTLLAVPLAAALQALPLAGYLALVAVAFLAGIGLCRRAGAALARADHPAIVWDELVGYLVTMTAAPPGWLALALGFALFRAFDILKPWPIGWVDERLHGGLGVMLDDLLAGIAACVVLHLILAFL